uniref:Uncharacterized protein n=1 Tax=Anguilla anguilla TaxID=7936 RepID=A0A0E9W654_ANGAN
MPQDTPSFLTFDLGGNVTMIEVKYWLHCSR